MQPSPVKTGPESLVTAREAAGARYSIDRAEGGAERAECKNHRQNGLKQCHVSPLLEEPEFACENSLTGRVRERGLLRNIFRNQNNSGILF